MKMCKECYDFLQPYFKKNVEAIYRPYGACDGCNAPALVTLEDLSGSIEVWELIQDALGALRECWKKHSEK